MSATSTALVSRASQTLTPAASSGSVQSPQRPGSTPSTLLTKPATPAPSPGTFRHPRLTEIISRQHRTTLNEGNIRSVTINAVAIFLSFYFSNDIHMILTTLRAYLGLVTTSTSESTTSTTILLLRVLFLTNIILSLRPVLPYVSQEDEITDIPLTPSQRALLGLPPSSSAPRTALSTTSSPNGGTSGYITPPRFQRQFSGSNTPSSTSQSQSYSDGRRSISANYSSSPMSMSRYTLGFSPSPSAPQTQPYARTRAASGSPFSPNASPLFHKAIRQQHNASQDLDFGVSGRSSVGAFDQSSQTGAGSRFGRSSIGLGRSQSVKERGRRDSQQATDSKGTPVAQKGVNYKWLYDKGLSGPASGSGRGGMVKSESMRF